MPTRVDVIAQNILEDPSKFLPKAAMEHVTKAQEELSKALEEIAKFADQKYLENNQEEFKRMYKALYPAIASSTDFNKSVIEAASRKIKNYQVAKTNSLMEIEKKLFNEKDLNEKEVLKIRATMLDKIKDIIAAEVTVGNAGSVAAVPAAVAAGAAVVAAAVEVVTLVRSVTSSSYVDRLIRVANLNPQLVELKHSQVINEMNIEKNKVIR